MGRLHDLGIKHGTDKATYHGYCDFYEHHIQKKITCLLEIGVKYGASLKMWRDYYPEAEIWGIDVNPPLDIDGCCIIQGDATYPDHLGDPLPRMFDVIIDDGSHFTGDQVRSFKLLYQRVKKGGLYIVEDIHTSFIPEYQTRSVTAYDFFKKNYNPIEFFRDPTNKTDSGTLIIRL